MNLKVGKYYRCTHVKDVILIESKTVKSITFRIVSDPYNAWNGTTFRTLKKSNTLLHSYIPMKAYNTPLYKVLNGGDN